ncbi:MAG: hypothetical protein OEX18_04500 [Candidatus Krumholzibacteria bacterium]|nr:hypothetical protein [Candidatus Krumholzibacteria bacterium]MDH4336519.1 hypothetical protein [Candidatus Krumholzibacteria bacterium]MDH5269600.1 hypothetical protein [Candidatus Krumholzibacteria bacterium]MDH5626910.1 hypothetical protein [Candidatus Krumholzibacteria bacterium]
MSFSAKLRHELVSLTLAWVYFVLWFGFLIALKKLMLEQYHIEFKGLSIVLVSALILAKVILLMEPIPLGKWVGRRPAWVDVVARTVLYSLGVVVVLVLEKGLEGRHEYGGFGASVQAQMRDTNAEHIAMNALCITTALLVYNALSVVQKNLGTRTLTSFFLKPLPEESSSKPAGKA